MSGEGVSAVELTNVSAKANDLPTAKLSKSGTVSSRMSRATLPSAGPLLKFFVITFALTWACFLTVWRLSGGVGTSGPASQALRLLLLYVGVFAPSFVAIGLTALAHGAAGVGALLRPLFNWRVGGRWYLLAFGYMAVIKSTVALIHRAVTGTWPQFGHEAWYVIVVATVLSTAIGGQAGEEIGWRGYALPRLANRVGFPLASVILGLIWACWHLPLFFVPGADKYGQSFVVYAVQVTALSVAIAWLYLRTGGSLLLTMLMHSAINQSKNIVPSAVPGAMHVLTAQASVVGWITAVMLWACAAYFLYRMRKTTDALVMIAVETKDKRAAA
jgi:membrane protease YdiL (CAAX protease family)